MADPIGHIDPMYGNLCRTSCGLQYQCVHLKLCLGNASQRQNPPNRLLPLTRGNLLIPGDRPSGIYTAGLAQTLINLYNLMPGKNIYILGSGDIGLIMARRLKLEGANVKGVIEILPYPSGLPRNIVQCLNDYQIP